jgi:hypothetical protein
MKRIDSDWGADDGGDHGLSMSMVVVVGFDFLSGSEHTVVVVVVNDLTLKNR